MLGYLLYLRKMVVIIMWVGLKLQETYVVSVINKIHSRPDMIDIAYVHSRHDINLDKFTIYISNPK